ncbi:MAG: PQQ-binding-like beta-propeller repeat protein [Planctomycetota bacterium]
MTDFASNLLTRRAALRAAFAGLAGSGMLAGHACAANTDSLDPVNNGNGWPQFLGPEGTGVVDGNRGVPETWSSTKSIRWRTELPGSGWSSPVHDGTHVYLSAAIDGESEDSAKRLVVQKLDLQSGALVATFPVFDQLDDRKYPIHSKNSHASPTLVIDGGQVIAHFGYQGTAALDFDGKKLWENRELTFPPMHGNGGSPLVLGDQIVFTCDGAQRPFVAALDRRDGRVRWRTDRPVDARMKFSFATPAAFRIDDKLQVIAPGSDCLCGLEPASGKLLWTFESPGFSVVPKAMRVGDTIVYCTGFMRPSLIAVDPGSAANGWQAREVWRVKRNVPKTPTPLLDGDGIVMVSDEGIVSRINAADGKVVYQKRLGGNFSASPIKVGTRIFLPAESGETTVIRSGNAYEKLATNDLGERTFATFAVVQDDLIVRTQQALYRIGS